MNFIKVSYLIAQAQCLTNWGDCIGPSLSSPSSLGVIWSRETFASREESTLPTLNFMVDHLPNYPSRKPTFCPN